MILEKFIGLSVHFKLINGLFNNSLTFVKTASTEWSMQILFWQGSGGRHFDKNKSLQGTSRKNKKCLSLYIFLSRYVFLKSTPIKIIVGTCRATEICDGPEQLSTIKSAC